MLKRIYDENNIQKIKFTVITTESVLSIWYLSYCALVSSAEKFIVRSASQLIRNDDNNDQLIKNLKVCFFQEIQHANSHDSFNDYFFKEKPAFKYFVKAVNFFNYALLEPILPSSLKLSIASAMEQLNAEISYYGLSHIDAITTDSYFKKILTWHFVEEIEHRDYVFDLMKRKKIHSVIQFFGIFIVLVSFSFWITLGAFLLSIKSFLFPQFFHVFLKKGVVQSLFASAKRYLKTGYHPSCEAIPNEFYTYQEGLLK